MPITIKPANIYTPKTSHKFMKSMASGGLARFIALEAFVETGRTYQAYKRGGFDEGRERITEEFTGAVFWLSGVKVFNKINDKTGKRLLNMRTADFDLGKDSARDTIANFIHKERSTKDAAKKFTENDIAKFKSAKLIVSILMANAMIGFVVPKINQAITRYYHRNDNALPKLENNVLPNTNPDNSLHLKDFVEKSKKDSNAKKDVSFGGMNLMSLAYNLEHNTTWQLLATDVGTATGRTISARNNNERREILFRDLSSIIFYMFNMPLVNMLLNKLEQPDGKSGRGSRVDSMNADYATDLMKQIVKENGGNIEAKLLAEKMFGENPEFKLPKSVSDKFKDGFMTLEEFKKEIPNIVSADEISKFTKIAEQMAELQPTVKDEARITLDQAERVFKGGYLNNPEFLKNLYELSFGKNKKTNLANFLNPYKFISCSEIEGVDGDLKYYVEQIIKKAEKSGKKISEDILTKASKANFRFNVLNWGTGFAISALFLSTLIPKMQYWLTKRITGKDEFPGTAEFKKQNETK